jgi:hypothetical protein
MSELVIQKLTKKQRESIRWMYFGNFEPTDIEIRTNIDIDTIRFFIFGEDGTGKDPTCLFQIKKNMSSTAISAFLFDKAAVFDQTAGVALSILNKSLMNLQVEVNNGKELTVDEMNKIATIVVGMDKMVRLESGLATETIEHIGLSRAEAREILASDPFAKEAVEVEFTETLPWLSKKNHE